MLRNSFFVAGVLSLGLALAGPALAKDNKDKEKDSGSIRVCLLTDISGPNASACSGWYEGNLNGGSPDKLAEQAVGLNALFPLSDPYTGPSLTWLGKMDGPGGDADAGVFSGNGSGGFTVNFNQLLYGQTIVSFHVGGANGQSNGIGYNATGFFLFDAGATGLDTFTLNVAGLSNAVLYSTGNPGAAIPEPSTWGMMLLGFAGAGHLIRRRRYGVA